MSEKCISCNIIKDITDFHKYKRSSDGVRARCKDCRKEHYIINADKERARVKKYYSENSEKVKKCQKEYGKNNRDLINARERKYKKNKRAKLILNPLIIS